jgi:glucokinase
MILAGDTGATKTVLTYFEIIDGKLRKVVEERYKSTEYNSLEEIIQSFLDEQSFTPQYACFGVPGPVVNGEVKVTNLPWRINEQSLKEQFNLTAVKLVNDLVAVAAAVPYLQNEDLYTLHRGVSSACALDEDCLSVVIAPGTGLGQALIGKFAQRNAEFGSEGGHIDFAPRNSVEIDLLQHMLKRLKRVSLERVLSGMGISNIYDFLSETNVIKPNPSVEERFVSKEAKPRVIGEEALTGSDPLCIKTIDIFVSILLSHAGNIALSYIPKGGIYLGGGIPPKLLDRLKKEDIAKDYLDKGRLSQVVEETPLYVINDDKCAVKGAGYIAKRLMNSK